jgi:citronellol/citronellal dehydrogenase
MSTAEPSWLLRAGLLDGVRVVLASGPEASGGSGFAPAAGSLCERLGARLAGCRASVAGAPEEREAATEQAVAGALGRIGGASILIVDAAGIYANAPGPDGLADALQASWDFTRALANSAFIGGSATGRILLLAPPSGGDDVHAAGAAAGLENLARTLSIEWARYGITIVAVAPGLHTPAPEVAALCAWLASPAGDYFSGCLLDLTGPRAAGA